MSRPGAAFVDDITDCADGLADRISCDALIRMIRAPARHSPLNALIRGLRRLVTLFSADHAANWRVAARDLFEGAPSCMEQALVNGRLTIP